MIITTQYKLSKFDFVFVFSGNNNYANQQHQRSRSFDASIGKKSPVAKSNLLSSLLHRMKGGVVSSSSKDTNNEVTDGSTSSTHASAPPSTPVSTVLVVDSSGCGPIITTLSPTPAATPQNCVSPQDKSPAGGGGTGKGIKVKHFPNHKPICGRLQVLFRNSKKIKRNYL